MIIPYKKYYNLYWIIFIGFIHNIVFGIDMYDVYHICKNKSPALRLQNETLYEKEGVLQSVKGYYDWTFSNELSSGKRYRPPTVNEQVLSLWGIDEVRATQYSTSLGILKLFKYGTIINPSIVLNKTDAGLPWMEPTYNVDMTISFVQPLFRLGNSKYQAIYKAAEIDLESEKSGTKHIFSTQLYYVLAAYWNYNTARDNHQIYLKSESKSNQFYEETLELIKADIRPESDINQLEADLAEKKVSLIQSEQMIIEYKKTLCQLLGVGFDELEQLNTGFSTFPENINIQSITSVPDEKLSAMALQNRKDILSASLDIKSAEVLLKSAKRDKLPDLSLEGLYGINGTDMGTSFGEAIKNNESQVSNFGIKLNLNLPLSNNTARGQYIRSKTLKNKAQINYEYQLNTIRLEVITAKNNLIAAKNSLDQVEKSVDRYNTVLDNEKLKFKEGITTLMELLLLQDRLILAELNLAEVRNEYIKAIIRFRYQIGILIPEQELSRQMLNEHFISIPAFNQDLN